MKNVSRQVNKVIVGLTILFLLVLGCLISLSFFEQRYYLKEEVQHAANMLADSVYRGMIFPMSVGEGETLRQQMVDFKNKMKGMEIFIFGFDRSSTYASEKEKVGSDLSQHIKSKDLAAALDRLLRDAKASEIGYEELIEGKPYLTVLRPILNESRCHHCHGASRSVLGGLMVRKSIDTVNSNLTSLRNKTIFGGIIGCVIVILALSFLISRLVIRPVNRLAEGLSESSAQVASASGQVSSASQSFAEGTSQQAAGIQETSSSLEEMSLMTKQNAENAHQANTVTRETSTVVDAANLSMKELTQSMNDISKASEETGKIIKTIDEIAFQTNLLALNAAVEAARAGEAGAGFAVVADEVRNLAMRASNAAKNTANLIEDTVRKIKKGSEIAGRTNEAFVKVAEAAKKVGGLVDEIAAASSEQARGFEQINKAVSEVDKVVQQNAANAEESASAAEQMNAQAGQIRDYAKELLVLLGSKKAYGLLSAEGLRIESKDQTPTNFSLKKRRRNEAFRSGSSHPVTGDSRPGQANIEPGNSEGGGVSTRNLLKQGGIVFKTFIRGE